MITKIRSSKRSVLEFLLLPANPSGERDQRFEEKCKFHSPTDMPPPPQPPPPTTRGVTVPARPPGPVPLAPSKQQEPLMRLIGINGTGEEALTDCVTDGAGKCWRLPAMEINDYWVSSPPSSA